MRYGVADYGMNVWYGGFYDLEQRLQDLKSIGFNGIERLEATSPAEVLEYALCYRRLGMDFATVRGTNVVQSMQWTSAMGKEYVWLTPYDLGREISLDQFCRNCNDMLVAMEKNRVKGVLHNHLGQRIQFQEELDEFMDKCPKANLLLDVGHLFGAGGDVPATIRKYGKRIVAVHFKDIFLKDATIGLDKWYDRLRFCELGGGNAGMDFKAIVDALKDIGYDGWVLVEHDTHTDDPIKQLKISLDLLKSLFGDK